MAAQKRQSDALDGLQAALTANPPRTDFFTAVWLLERMTREFPRIGGDGPFAREALLFRHDPSFAFRPNDISDVRQAEVARSPEERLEARHSRYEITTCILGLTGADSPMPLYHAEELVYETESAHLQRLFLDLFHNRLAALLFRAGSKYNYPREFLLDAADFLSARTLALAGVDAYGAGATGPLRRTELLRLSALLALGSSSGRSLENGLAEILSHDLEGADLKLRQLVGGWIPFDKSQRNSLGTANTELGERFVLGTRVLHPAHRARVVIGPISPEQARDFSPKGRHFARVQRVVEAMSTAPVVFELELLVDENAFPPFILTSVGGRRLGDDVVLSAGRRSGRLASRVFELNAQEREL